MRIIIEILLGAFVGFIYLKPVFGEGEFPPQVGPNQILVEMEKEAFFDVGKLVRSDFKPVPQWMRATSETGNYGVYIKTPKDHHYMTDQWLSHDSDRYFGTPFNPRMHKPKVAWLRLGDGYYTARGFEDYDVRYAKSISECEPYGCFYIGFPTGAVWTALLIYHPELSPPKKTRILCFGCLGGPSRGKTAH